MARNTQHPSSFNPFITLSFIPLLTFFLIIGIYPEITHAASIQYQLRLQSPQVGYIGKPYEWTFSSSTFRPDQKGHDGSSLSYRVPALPAWMSFDPSTRTFSGTPSAGDVGSTNVQVFVSEVDDSDSVDSFRLIVSDASPPEQHRSLASQFVPENESISSANVVPATEGPGVRVRQAWSFSVGIEWDTFISPSGKEIFYSASLADREPLPDWITFNPKALTFDGITPRIRSDADRSHFEFYVYGSEVEGYASIQNTFSFGIDGPYPTDNIPDETPATDTLLQVAPLIPINVTAGDSFSYDLDEFDFVGLVLNDSPISRSSMSDILLDTSGCSWLTYDDGTSRLSGTPPLEYLHHPLPVLPIEITTKHNASIATNITLHVLPSAFTTTTLPPLVSPPGSRLQFELDEYFANNTEVGHQLIADPSSMTVTTLLNPREASSWVNFDPATHILTGTVPGSLDYNTLTIAFYALDPKTNANSTSSLVLDLAAASQNQSTDDKERSSHHNRVVVGSVIGVICGMILLVLLIAAGRWWCLQDGTSSQEGDYHHDQGVHQDGVVPVIRAPVQQGEVDKEGFETVDLGVPTHQQNPLGLEERTPSSHTGSSTLHSSEAKTTRGAFFTKLKVLSERSIGSVSTGTATKSRQFGGKENFTTGGRAKGGAFGEPGNSRPKISRPMRMAPGSSGKALHIGMRTGTTPPVSPKFSTVVPTVMTSSVSSGSIPDATRNHSRSPPAMPPSRSTSSLGSSTGMNPSNSRGSQIGTDESGQFLEGGIDRNSLAEEPDYVWASGKISMSPKSKQSFRMQPTGVVPVRSSLDSVIPKRRKDFCPPPRLVTPTDRADPRLYPTPILPSIARLSADKNPNHPSLHTSNLHSTDRSTKRVSAVSFESVDLPLSSQSHEEAVITQVTSRHVVAGVAAAKKSIQNLRQDRGVESPIGGRTQNPRLAQFPSNHGGAATAQAGLPSPRGHVASSSELEDRLSVGIDYVRHFGMDGDSVFGGATRIPRSISERSWRSEMTGSGPEEQPHCSSYQYHHRNHDISGMSTNSNSPSLSSTMSAIATPDTFFTPIMPPASKLQGSLRPGHPKNESDSSDSLSRRSTHRILVGAGQPFNFSVPLTAPKESIDDGEEVDIEARLDDGDNGVKRLPDWLRFDKKAMEFWGVPPPDTVKPGVAPSMIGVSVWQDERCLATFMVEVVAQ
ncbi:hypothetical protein FRC04_007170 [Tulasnella sp. 424]|nr:hypothetical protein FRC04_007170 [Tulasnella sp. 424]KAG8974607.1 hypothetical protein FRC05_007083 [Tulasnella sp. 425]